MSGRALAEFSDYGGMLAAVRARVKELQVAGAAFDQYAGLPDKYLSKLIGERPVRRIGMMSMGPLFAALGVSCVMLEDPAATARIKNRIKPRNGSFVRTTHTVRAVTDRQWSRIQKLGRKARWKKLSRTERSDIMRAVSLKRWGR
jgi:hypothetical protein